MSHSEKVELVLMYLITAWSAFFFLILVVLAVMGALSWFGAC